MIRRMKPVAIAYLVAVHAALLVLFLRSETGLPPAMQPAVRAPAQAFLAEMRYIHRYLDPNIPAGAVLFAGDSITQYLPTGAVAPSAVNLGIAGQRSDQLLESMEGYASMTRARAVVLMIGTNDLLQGQEAGIGDRYRAIVQKVPSAVPALLVAVPPVRGKDRGPLVRAAREACGRRAGCRFVDPFAEGTDLLGDGVHLSPAGNAMLVQALKGALAAAGVPAP